MPIRTGKTGLPNVIQLAMKQGAATAGAEQQQHRRRQQESEVLGRGGDAERGTGQTEPRRGVSPRRRNQQCRSDHQIGPDHQIGVRHRGVAEDHTGEYHKRGRRNRRRSAESRRRSSCDDGDCGQQQVIELDVPGEEVEPDRRHVPAVNKFAVAGIGRGHQPRLDNPFDAPRLQPDRGIVDVVGLGVGADHRQIGEHPPLVEEEPGGERDHQQFGRGEPLRRKRLPRFLPDDHRHSGRQRHRSDEEVVEHAEHTEHAGDGDHLKLVEKSGHGQKFAPAPRREPAGQQQRRPQGGELVDQVDSRQQRTVRRRTQCLHCASFILPPVNSP